MIRLGRNLKSILKQKEEVLLDSSSAIYHQEISAQNNQFCNLLKKYFNDTFCDSEFEYNFSNDSSILDIVDINVSLYIRIQVISNLKRTIEIGSIRFTEERVGHGQAFLEYILSITEEFSITEIKILSANEKSEPFAKKNGFERLKSNDYILKVVPMDGLEPSHISAGDFDFNQ